MFNIILKMRDFFIVFKCGEYLAEMYWSGYWARYVYNENVKADGRRYLCQFHMTCLNNTHK